MDAVQSREGSSTTVSALTLDSSTNLKHQGRICMVGGVVFLVVVVVVPVCGNMECSNTECTWEVVMKDTMPGGHGVAIFLQG